MYIKKVDESKDYPLLFRHHMYTLHQLFVNNRQKIYLDTVQDYINNLDSSNLYNIINFYSSK